MKQWLRSKLLSKWLHVAGAAVSAGSIGYTTAIYQRQQENKLLVHIDENRKFPLRHQTSIFPSTVFAATKMEDSLIPTTEELVSEPPLNAPRISQIMRYGFPSLTNIRSLDDYVLSYDTRTRVPHWVFEHLTTESLDKRNDVDRSNCDFHEDGSVHEYFRSTAKDYKYSGFDRGHLAAAGNHRLSMNSCQQTFLLTNMAPQVGKGFNRNKWNELEKYCRKLARQYRNVYVCTGTLFLPRAEEDGNLYVRYRVLGSNHVAVPTHFFKIVVCESEKGELTLESFVLPNAVIEDRTPITSFYVPLDVVERASGLLLFDKLNRSKFNKINGKKTGWL